MIVYVDPSVIVRALLPDEAGHEQARSAVLSSTDALITGSWSRVEVAAALARASKASRGAAAVLQKGAEAIFTEQYVVPIDAEQAEVELLAKDLVWSWAIRPLDAWHLACAQLAREDLLDTDEELGFMSFDKEQARVAEKLGFTVL